MHSPGILLKLVNCLVNWMRPRIQTTRCTSRYSRDLAICILQHTSNLALSTHRHRRGGVCAFALSVLCKHMGGVFTCVHKQLSSRNASSVNYSLSKKGVWHGIPPHRLPATVWPFRQCTTLYERHNDNTKGELCTAPLSMAD